MSQSKTDEYLNEHIPYRLTIIDALCMAQLQAITPHLNSTRRLGYCSTEFSIQLASGRRCAPVQGIHNLAIEAGLISCRMLLNFLGISRDNSSGAIKEYPGRSTDFKFENVIIAGYQNAYQLDYADINRAEEFIPSHVGRPISIRAVLSTLFENADKAAGHLVEYPKPIPGLEWYHGAVIASLLVEDLVYHQYDRPKPSYSLWTGSLLEDEVRHIHRLARESIREFLRSTLYPNAFSPESLIDQASPVHKGVELPQHDLPIGSFGATGSSGT